MTDGAGKTPSNPYIGARPFRKSERIYGRTREARDLLSMLVGDRIVLLNSPSGAGKSSLIQAALIPTLERRRFVVRPTIRVNAETALAGANRYLLSVMQSLEEARPQAERLADEQMAGLTLDAYLQQRASADARDGQVLIFDQFEEVLTLDPTDEAARAAFFEQLGDALADPWRWALFAIREEYVAALEPYLHLVPTRFANTFRLELLGVEAAVEAICGPAKASGAGFDEGVAEGLAHDLAKIIVQDAEGRPVERAGVSVEPVQLQVVCYRLWERRFPDRADPQGQTISAEDVQAHGKVDNALQEFYDSGVEKAAARAKVSERAVRAWVDTQLITRQGFRNQVVSGNEAAFGLNRIAVEELTNAYVVRVEQRGTIRIELAHDRLIGPARASNRSWFEANLSPLQRQTEVWVAQNRPGSLLFRDAELLSAEQWAAQHEAALTADERRFLEDCRDERRRAEERARQARRIRNLAIGASVLAVLAMIAFVAALGFFNQANANFRTAEANGQTAVANQHAAETQQALAIANEQRAQAQQAVAESNARVSRARELAAASLAQAGRDPDLGLILGLGAFAATRPTDEQPGERLDALYQNLQAARLSQAFSDPKAQRALAVTYSRDGSSLAIGSFDGSLRIWQPADQVIRWERAISSTDSFERVNAVALSPDGRTVASGTSDDRVRLWDAETGASLSTTDDLGDWVRWLNYSPDGTLLAASGDFGQAIVFDAATMTPRFAIPHNDYVFKVAFSGDGRLVASASADQTAAIWDVAAQRELARYSFNNSISSVALNGDGSLLAIAPADRTVRIWSVGEQRELFQLTGHAGNVFDVAFSPDGRTVASAATDSTVRIWSAADGALITVLSGHQGQINAIAFRPDGRFLASASDDGSVRIWDLGMLNGNPVLALAASPDGSMIAAVGRGGEAKLWSAQDGRLRFALLGHTDDVRRVAFSPDGSRIATASIDKTVRIWDVADGRQLQVLSQPDEARAVAFSPDGTLLATAGLDANVYLYQLGQGQPIATLGGFELRVNHVAFSPDGRLLAAAGADNLVRIWDVQTRAERLTLPKFDDDINRVSFSPDSRQLAVAGDFQAIYVYTLDAPDAPLKLDGHTGDVIQADFSPSGDRIVSCADDRQVIIWGRDGSRVQGFTQPDVPYSCIFSADGSRVLAAGVNSVVRSYPLDQQALLADAERRLTRAPTEAECALFRLDPCARPALP